MNIDGTADTGDTAARWTRRRLDIDHGERRRLDIDGWTSGSMAAAGNDERRLRVVVWPRSGHTTQPAKPP